ncbi:MAG: putative tRNA threonylcarbamoyladenosine biosynthesis protein Gcp [Candidatus Magasanikbacteria bacterium GW2011_GWA2_56_11]|uniref:tRNA N6-adenosine threonylcarbamoyltransferase n=1 Tax=Candidatus Magasanikbacteria bacterium GW2011_GWA2_56_11 TaxID=1619044 RepID=A0A0G2ANS2_9BACT|nr:MAG: putative tRNA threonylcarbamoyladenosine biosynthesis protein Gcp [Candidatus Magasanikbacteria bacterium GW2011_GWA2_56_11]
MRLLGIESSCDDTSVALLQADEGGLVVLSEKTASQIPIHQKYGGVVPEVAGRAHAENIFPVVEAVMAGQEKPDAVAVTTGPGLITGLMVGAEAAKALSYLWDVPLIAVNHIAGHIHSAEIKADASEPRREIAYPALALVVSGGHTELIYLPAQGRYELAGKTRDDAAGECFDKVAKLIGFDYPGGPRISQCAAQGNPGAIPFPRPMLNDNTFAFSFAGLKTAALYWLRDHGLAAAHVNPLSFPAGYLGQGSEPPTVADFCASFEAAIVEVLTVKTLRAAEKFRPRTVVLGGGVSANKKLRETLARAIGATTAQTPVLIPHLRYTADNGAMIAAAGYYRAIRKEFTAWSEIVVNPNWEVYG